MAARSSQNGRPPLRELGCKNAPTSAERTAPASTHRKTVTKEVSIDRSTRHGPGCPVSRHPATRRDGSDAKAAAKRLQLEGPALHSTANSPAARHHPPGLLRHPGFQATEPTAIAQQTPGFVIGHPGIFLWCHTELGIRPVSAHRSVRDVTASTTPKLRPCSEGANMSRL